MTPVLRRQLPAVSPLTLRGVLAGIAGMLHEPARRRTDVGDLLRTRFAASDVLLTGRGTTALQLTLAAVRAFAPDRPIALPAYCCFDIATAADGADVQVVLYDLDPETLGPDGPSLRRALEREPSAVVAAHLFG